MRLDQLVETIGEEAALALIQRWGGRQECIPMPAQLEREKRNASIRRLHKAGFSHAFLVWLFQLSRRQIINILNEGKR